MTETKNAMERRPERPEAPDGWHWGIGSRSAGFYTHWLYTDAVLYNDGEFGWECEVYWDLGGDGTHKVAFYQYESMNPNGDHRVCDYPTHAKRFGTEEEALQYAVQKAAELR